MTPQQLEALMSWVREVAKDAAMHEDGESKYQRRARLEMYDEFGFEEGVVNEPVAPLVLTGDNP